MTPLDNDEMRKAFEEEYFTSLANIKELRSNEYGGLKDDWAGFQCGWQAACNRPALKAYESAKTPTDDRAMVERALEEAARIVLNLKPEMHRDKVSEWEACYAALFRQLNEVVQSHTAAQNEKLREAVEKVKCLPECGLTHHVSMQDVLDIFEQLIKGE